MVGSSSRAHLGWCPIAARQIAIQKQFQASKIVGPDWNVELINPAIEQRLERTRR
jgi:hypothetical protein